MDNAERFEDDMSRHFADNPAGNDHASFGRRRQSDVSLHQGAADGTGRREVNTANTPEAASHQRYLQGQRRPVGRLVLLKRIARIGGALLAIGLLVFAANKGYRYYQLSPDQLYAEAFLPYQIPAAIADTAQGSSIVRFFQGHRFDSVIRRAKKQVLLSQPETLLTGISYLVADDPFWAINPLKKLSEGAEKSLAPEADFYLALAYLKNKDYDYALTVIQRIKREPHHKYGGQFPEALIKKVEMLKWR
jgi:hypothetical protein